MLKVSEQFEMYNKRYKLFYHFPKFLLVTFISFFLSLRNSALVTTVVNFVLNQLYVWKGNLIVERMRENQPLTQICVDFIDKNVTRIQMSKKQPNPVSYF